MKLVEVSAICGRFAISPDAESIYMYWPNSIGAWRRVDLDYVGKTAMSLWVIFCFNTKVHRGIFKIKVVED